MSLRRRKPDSYPFVAHPGNVWVHPVAGTTGRLTDYRAGTPASAAIATVTCSGRSSRTAGTTVEYEVSYDCLCKWEFDGDPPDHCPAHSTGPFGIASVPLGLIGSRFSFTSASYVVSLAGVAPFVSYTALAEERAPQPELELRFDTEPIVGYRVWRLVDFERRGGIVERRLAPIVAKQTWPPMRRFEACCTAGNPSYLFADPGRDHERHEAPWRDCTCGVWAVRDPSVMANVQAGVSGATVTGTVHLWGRVLEFEKGYRAQYAYPRELTAESEEVARDLRALYGVPVTVCSP